MRGVFYVTAYININKHLKSLVSRDNINCFPRDQYSSNLLYNWEFIKPRCNDGRRSTFAGNSALLPLTSKILQCCPPRDFGGKQFY